MRNSARSTLITSVLIALTVLAVSLKGGAAAGPPMPPASPHSSSDPGHGEGYVADEILIQLSEPSATQARGRLGVGFRIVNERMGIPSLDGLASQFGVREIHSFRSRVRPDSPLADFYQVRLGPGRSALEAVAKYRKDPAVRVAQLNYLYTPDLAPNDTLYSQQYAHQKTSAEAGWNIETGQTNPVTIAIIGTGFDLNHPDLQSKFLPGYDFYEEDNNPSPLDMGPTSEEFHETFVAGCAAAATNNALGVAGACWGCMILPLRAGILNYATVDVSQAIDYAVTHGAKVINMSFGSYTPNVFGPDTAVETSINAGFTAGVVMVGTAGNNSVNTIRYPGALENVIDVAATDSADHRWGNSNFGSWVDVAAPGGSVLGTTFASQGSYFNASGTSFSAPYVAGLAALLLSKNPTLTPTEVRLRIEYSADHIQADHYIGSGRVNMFRALSLNASPDLFAVIKSPDHNAATGPSTLQIMGTALGDSYVLEYKPSTSSTWTQIANGPQKINDVLGSLDASTIPLGTQFQIRLTATKGAATDQDVITLFQVGPSGWIRPTGFMNSHSSVVTADLDGDGRQEVLVGTQVALNVWTEDGDPFPGFPAFGILSMTTPAVGNIDGDGDPEIVVASVTGPKVHAWNINGTDVAGFPLDTGVTGQSGQYYWSAPTLANLDADPALEIILPSQSGVVHILNGDGSNLTGWPKTLDGNIQTSAAVGDIDGDGQLEIVIKQFQKTYAFNIDGSTVPGWPHVSADSGHVSPVLGGINGDSILDVVVAEGHFNPDHGTVMALDGSGNTLFQTQVPTRISDDEGALGDMDLDGDLEYFVGDVGGKIYGFNSQGTQLPGWPVQMSGAIIGSPIIADIDGDGQKEAIAATASGSVYAWNLDGSLALGPITVDGQVSGTPAVADLDADGDIELIVGTTGSVYVFDLPGAWNPQKADWPMLQNNAQHTGVSNVDSDNDGDPNLTDCGPANPAIHHGATEICNLVDDNCVAGVDEGFDGDLDGYTTCGGDCNDFAWEIHPGATEVCNWADDDCDGQIDEGFDADQDGYISCYDDCNDANPAVHPGATEVCNGMDDNCNGYTDEAPDADGDGYACANDCNDSNPLIFGQESAFRYASCFDNLDNDCDGVTDFDCAVDVGDTQIVVGSVSGLTNMRAASTPDDQYESIAEGNPGKKTEVYLTFYNPPSGAWYDLRAEGMRVPGNGDNFILTKSVRTVAGKCDGSANDGTYSTGLTISNLTDDDRIQFFQFGPPEGGSSIAFCVKVLDSNQGSDNKADTLKLDKFYLMPVLLHAKAQSEIPGIGTMLNGTTYFQTQSSDNVTQAIREAGADEMRHTWRIPDVPIGYTHYLHIEGSRTHNTDPSDDFQFYYANPSSGVCPTNDVDYTIIPGAVVNVAVGGINADFQFGPNNTLVGTVCIRVRDTVPNGPMLERLNIDYLAIKTTP